MNKTLNTVFAVSVLLLAGCSTGNTLTGTDQATTVQPAQEAAAPVTTTTAPATETVASPAVTETVASPVVTVTAVNAPAVPPAATPAATTATDTRLVAMLPPEAAAPAPQPVVQEQTVAAPVVTETPMPAATTTATTTVTAQAPVAVNTPDATPTASTVTTTTMVVQDTGAQTQQPGEAIKLNPDQEILDKLAQQPAQTNSVITQTGTAANDGNMAVTTQTITHNDMTADATQQVAVTRAGNGEQQTSTITQTINEPGTETAVPVALYGFDQWQKGPLGDVFFEFDSSALSADAKNLLIRNAEWMGSNSNGNIDVEGHCDARGTSEYNLALGERRSTAVKEYITRLGVQESRINIVSFGEERPFDTNKSAEGMSHNRRAHFVIK